MKNKPIRFMMKTLVLTSLVASVVLPTVMEVKAEGLESTESSQVDQSTESTSQSSQEVSQSTELEESSQSVEKIIDELNPLPRLTKSTEKGYVPAAPEEIKAANEAANAKMGFNPEV